MKKQNSIPEKTPVFLKMAALTLVWVAPLSFLACGSKEKSTMETRETKSAEHAVESYADKPSEAAKADVTEAFAALDKEIAELEARVASTSGEKRAEADVKLQELKQRRSELKGEYTKAKFDALLEDVKNAVR
jgi:hypothetical protein